jgi:ATP-binding cassette subfamily B multidrug efflux pump
MAEEQKRTTAAPRRAPMHGPGMRLATEKPKDLGATLRRLAAYLVPYLPLIVVSVVMTILSVAFSVVGPKLLGDATSTVFDGIVAQTNGTGGIDFATIGQILALLLAIYTASWGAQALSGWLMTGVTQKTVFRMRGQVAEKISRVPLSYFDGAGTSKGDVLSRMTNDVDTVGQSLTQVVTQLISSVVQIAGVLIMMIMISLPLACVTLITLPVSAVLLSVIMKRSQPYFRAQQAELGVVNGIVEEDISGQTVVQAFNRAEEESARFKRENDRLYESAWKSQFVSGLMQPVMNLVGNMGYVAVVVVGAALCAQGSIRPGDIQAFIQYVKSFTQPVAQLANIANVIQQMAAAAERVFAFLEAPEEA